MYQILDFFKVVFQFAFEFMSYPIDIYGFNITLWEVFIFVFLGSVLISIIDSFYD